jgi:hypothetical protein
MMEALSISEMLVNFYQTTWHSSPEDSPVPTFDCENLTFHMSSSLQLYKTWKVVYLE